MTIYVPSSGPDDWKRLLAEPEKHWRAGYSARRLAECWERASGLPSEVAALLPQSEGLPPVLLHAFPEHRTPLPGSSLGASQSDLFALVRTPDGLYALTIEGKVDEPFGPTIGEWLVNASPGKRTRLAYLCQELGIEVDRLPLSLRYQLLHRSVSAIIEARRYGAAAAAMVVHSFSPTRRWFQDFVSFARMLGSELDEPGRLARLLIPNSMPLFVGWVSGVQVNDNPDRAGRRTMGRPLE